MKHIQKGFAKENVPSIPELLSMAQELGVKIIACQMTMDVMNLDKDQFVDGIEVGGAASFVHYASDANMTLTF